MSEAAGRKQVYTIPAGNAFADQLARGVMQRFIPDGDWRKLPKIRILVPTRRSVVALQDAFRNLALAQKQRAVLLPSIQPLGDVEEEELLLTPGNLPATETESLSLPPTVSAITRELILARQILLWSERQQEAGLQIGASGLAQALRLARELGQFIDSFKTENIDPGKLDDLVPENYAAMWQQTLAFLKIVTEHWPKILEQDLGAIDAVDRRNRLLNGLAAHWRVTPPDGPVIAAGSTGSIPATAELMTTILDLPLGAVVLPGLDLDLDDRGWDAVDASHPQFGMKELLGGLQVSRRDVMLWSTGASDSESEENRQRRRLVQSSLRPAAATDDWREIVESFDPDDWRHALAGLHRIDAAHPGEEAMAIAIILRESLEKHGQSAALVTPDRGLARRVAANLKRWDIDIDDSAGMPLADTTLGRFLRLIVEVVESDLEPVGLLALLKHPMCSRFHDRQAFRELVWQFERLCLRGPAPAPGIEGLRGRLTSVRTHDRPPVDPSLLDAFERLIDRLAFCLDPLSESLAEDAMPLSKIVSAHILCAQRLYAFDSDVTPDALWSGDVGEAAAGFFRALLDQSEQAPPLKYGEYGSVIETLVAQQTVRTAYGQHPGLYIWGPLEARLLMVDTVVIGSLNEGVWPAAPQTDAWLNRPMRAQLGLPLPERRLGLSAHDFVQLACMPRVFMTRSERVDGAPTVPSRWLLRIETLLKGAGQFDALGNSEYLSWVRQLGESPEPKPWGPPAPKPPLKARPRKFSVTEIETWLRDPYAIYAKKILNLSPLEEIGSAPDRMQRGILVHNILDEFATLYPVELPEDAYDKLVEIGEKAFADLADQPQVANFWWPRFEHIAEWFVENERERRRDNDVRRVYSEKKGSISLDVSAGEFVLSARADRIDSCAAGYAIYDYKTGTPPSKAQVHSFLSPQLPLEALIVAAGGFEDVEASMPSYLGYIRLKGGEIAGAVIDIALDRDEVSRLASEAQDGLLRWIAAFDDPETPYRSRPRVQFESAYGDYDHLARVLEWPARQKPGKGGDR